ncbi:conserved hypothetical protein [Carnobacterium maltaromaticum]|uniref:hypothetical protein n=2 Tax=Lactobacillales TaxID=186826 RepID=UPI00191B9F0A|nr:hypothetical protein [Carnobacterium maltaromaticum]CAD5900134.1 conserved hypothetical protein [Carnobacterium maltaromaticum]CAD5902640.1 conserved hypothetical protein [Carnobacterium maltaromaticum]
MKNNKNSKKIDIYMQSSQKTYGNYYMPGNAHLDTELVQHLVLLASDKKIEEKLELAIWKNEVGDNEKFITALKNTFTDMIGEVNNEIRINIKISVISMLAGVIIGIVSNMLAIDNEQLSSIILIAVWVFIWYSVETYVFDNMKLRLKIKRYRQIMNGTIQFEHMMDSNSKD